MQQTRAQVQLQYHQTLSRIVEMEVLAEQMTKLADSYGKEKRNKKNALREEDGVYTPENCEESPEETLQMQAKVLKSAAEDWYRRAREEYQTSLQKIKMKEEQEKSW